MVRQGHFFCACRKFFRQWKRADARPASQYHMNMVKQMGCGTAGRAGAAKDTPGEAMISLPNPRRWRLLLLFALIPLMTAWLGCGCKPQEHTAAPSPSGGAAPATTAGPLPSSSAGAAADSHQTEVLMHNVILNEGPSFKLRVRWLRGKCTLPIPGSFLRSMNPVLFRWILRQGRWE